MRRPWVKRGDEDEDEANVGRTGLVTHDKASHDTMVFEERIAVWDIGKEWKTRRKDWNERLGPVVVERRQVHDGMGPSEGEERKEEKAARGRNGETESRRGESGQSRAEQSRREEGTGLTRKEGGWATPSQAPRSPVREGAVGAVVPALPSASAGQGGKEGN